MKICFYDAPTIATISVSDPAFKQHLSIEKWNAGQSLEICFNDAPTIAIVYESDAILQYPLIENGTLVNPWKAHARCGGRQTLGQTQYNTLQTAISINSEGNFQLYDCIVQKHNYHGEVIGFA